MTAVAPAPQLPARRTTGGSLARAELRRLTSRRFIRLLVLLGASGVLLWGASQLFESRLEEFAESI